MSERAQINKQFIAMALARAVTIQAAIIVYKVGKGQVCLQYYYGEMKSSIKGAWLSRKHDLMAKTECPDFLLCTSEGTVL